MMLSDGGTASGDLLAERAAVLFDVFSMKPDLAAGDSDHIRAGSDIGVRHHKLLAGCWALSAGCSRWAQGARAGRWAALDCHPEERRSRDEGPGLPVRGPTCHEGRAARSLATLGMTFRIHC